MTPTRESARTGDQSGAGAKSVHAKHVDQRCRHGQR